MIFVMKIVVMGTSRNLIYDGAPCAVKVACTVRTGGKAGDYIKRLPISIINTSDAPAVAGRLWRLCR